jgi:hypothetical protein
MSSLQILVETVALGDELLLPLSETLFLHLDLLCETLAQVFLLFLELGVVQLARTGLAELSRLHLLSTISLVVRLLGGMDEVQHVSPDENGTQLLEIAVILVLHFGYTPGILAALDNLALVVLDVLLGSNDGEWHGGHQAAGMSSGVFVVFLNRRLVNLDTLGFHNGTDLFAVSMVLAWFMSGLTLCL